MKVSALFLCVVSASISLLVGCKSVTQLFGNNTQAVANAEESQENHCASETENGHLYINMQCHFFYSDAHYTATKLDEWAQNGRKGPEPQGHICVVPSTKFTDRYAVSVNCVLQISGEQQKEEFQAWSVPAGETLEGIRKRYGVSVNQ